MAISPTTPAYVAYYRVSTDRQGVSGLGLAAQRDAVSRFVVTGQLVAEFTEVESGHQRNRPQLAAALAECRQQRATLVIAKLDRLARNVHFISGLMESRVDFICCDNPHANKTMLQMMAVFAEHEREMISQRTKAALAEAKRRGTKLGNPRLEEARQLAMTANRRPVAPDVLKLMQDLQAQGKTLREIAGQLNRLHIRTDRGNQWYASTVRSQLSCL